MRRFATWTTGHRKTVIISWAVALFAMIAISGSVGADFSEEFSLPDSDSKEALDLLEEKFPAQSGETAQIVFKADSGVESAAVKRKMEKVFSEVEEEPHVSEVASPYESGGAAAVSDDGKIAYATVQFDVAGPDLDTEEAERVMKTAQAAASDGLQIELGGSPIEEVRGEEEEGFSEAIGLLAAIVVLLLTFGSVVAMGLPIITALFALGVGISFITLGTHVFNTADFAPQLAFMIGLGVGVDYALFILTRFRNGLTEGYEPREAAIAAIDTAGRAVLFAAITVIIALLGMMLLGLSFLYGVAVAAALAVFFTMVSALTLLPALLTIVGRRVDRLRIPGLGRGKRSVDEGTWWSRWSARIQRRPWTAALLSGALLLALCIPTLSLRLGTNDAGTDPEGTTTRQAYDLLAEGFGTAIAEKLPLFIGVVVLLSALLLMIVFRSIWVPLKAIVMNLLSIGAAFGLIVAVFQWGWGASLIGVDSTGPIISFFPIFLFSIVFGLSMDYEVFLMSRIHEEWEHTKDASEAVTRGLALTGRVITASAAIMVTVFAAFMLVTVRIIKLLR